MNMPGAMLRLLLACNSLQSGLNASITQLFHEELVGRDSSAVGRDSSTERPGNERFYQLFPKERVPALMRQVLDMPPIDPGCTLDANQLNPEVEYFMTAACAALVESFFGFTSAEILIFWNDPATQAADLLALEPMRMHDPKFLKTLAGKAWSETSIKLSSVLLTPRAHPANFDSDTRRETALCTWARSLRKMTLKVITTVCLSVCPLSYRMSVWSVCMVSCLVSVLSVCLLSYLMSVFNSNTRQAMKVALPYLTAPSAYVIDV